MTAPNTAPETLPARLYSDPAVWTAERTAVFARSWQFVGHEAQLAETGQWIADEIAGYPVMVVRDERGVLRGFHNVCRHRAGPLTEGSEGRCEKALTCRYHGWTYAFDGRLRAARDFGPAAGFDPRDYGLIPLRVETWRGLVFVAIDATIEPLTEWLAPLDERLGATHWRDFGIAARQAHPLVCDWKTYVENYMEGYHVPVLHPSLAAEIDVDRYSVRMEDRVAIHEVPPKPGAVYDGLWAWVWPNTCFNVYAAGMMMERISPLGAGRCRLDYTYLTPGGAALPPETLAMSAQVVAEDKWISEQVQKNLEAGVYTTGRLSPKHEIAIAAFQGMIREALGLN
jgi:choline monooxygenase